MLLLYDAIINFVGDGGTVWFSLGSYNMLFRYNMLLAKRRGMNKGATLLMLGCAGERNGRGG